MAKITCSVGSKPLSPAIPVVAKWAHELSGHSGRDGGYAWIQQYMDFYSPEADMVTSAMACQVYQHQRPTMSSDMLPFPWGTSQQPAGRLTTSSMGRAMLCLYRSVHAFCFRSFLA